MAKNDKPKLGIKKRLTRFLKDDDLSTKDIRKLYRSATNKGFTGSSGRFGKLVSKKGLRINKKAGGLDRSFITDTVDSILAKKDKEGVPETTPIDPTIAELPDIGGKLDDLISSINVPSSNTVINQYAKDTSDLENRLKEMQNAASQFAMNDASFVGGKNAAGVRLRRSKKYRSGNFAQGTQQLNRKMLSRIKGVNI